MITSGGNSITAHDSLRNDVGQRADSYVTGGGANCDTASSPCVYYTFGNAGPAIVVLYIWICVALCVESSFFGGNTNTSTV